MINKHITLLPNKFKKNINCVDLTFGFGGYNVLNNYKLLISIDKNLYSKFVSKKNYNKNFFIFITKIKNVKNILKRFKFNKINLLIYDQGFNSCEIKNFFFFLDKKKYLLKKHIINNNLKYIFNNLICYCSKNLLFVINTFNIYEQTKIYLFLKKIKKFNLKKIKINFFEISLNNGFKKSLMNFIYVKKNS
ncbi:S-adenosyl methyltransferase [Candidatus Carsonella ruddii]|uniref:Uncharacterized protein n=1 Tax=Carsonella ruddii TaxID=114186 RepID=A0AAE7KMA2_CARRU|nr:S-adenosyl methyltransferase [Candidatus Carsonella ruddii]AGS06548.1 S-adenosyl-methyltransferase [Candidatus Carsonella ruddii DC]ALA96805.1 hypothetical protein AMC76_00315 [Candidatus Carsonella ruddii]QLK14029.1 hypothetical protein FK493_00305 [Candidatus Carsonella ruddii]